MLVLFSRGLDELGVVERNAVLVTVVGITVLVVVRIAVLVLVAITTVLLGVAVDAVSIG